MERGFVSSRRGAAWVALLALAVGAGAARAAIFRIGPATDGACDANSISAALIIAALNNEDDEIRLANEQTYNNVYLPFTDFPNRVTIVGGFANCSAASPSGSTTLHAQTTHPVVETSTTTGANDIVLRNLQLLGPGTSFAISGIRVAGNSHVQAFATEVAGFGDSGVFATGSQAHLELDIDSLVHDNYGFHGGGVRCGSQALVDVSGQVSYNDAANGGGVFAGSCSVGLHPGAVVNYNHASADGGGVYVNGGGHVHLVATSYPGAGINVNAADDQGGGIYARDIDTLVLIDNGAVNSNTAGTQGGGIYADALADVILERLPGFCFFDTRCVDLMDNHLVTGNQGAAAFGTGGAQIQLMQAQVHRNSVAAGAAFGSIVHADGAETIVALQGVAMSGNTNADTLLEGTNSGYLRAGFVSGGGNTYTCGGSTCPDRPIVLSGAATASLYSSVFYPNSPVLAGANGELLDTADCLMLSDATNLPAGAFFVLADPEFVDVALNDLHLKPRSPAVDFCDAPPYTAVNDLDGEARPYDLPWNANGSPGVGGGTYDLGADEVRPTFADGFESGDLSRWPIVAP
jgi:predicted outer membrane repeat protein